MTDMSRTKSHVKTNKSHLKRDKPHVKPHINIDKQVQSQAPGKGRRIYKGKQVPIKDGHVPKINMSRVTSQTNTNNSQTPSQMSHKFHMKTGKSWSPKWRKAIPGKDRESWKSSSF